MMRNGLLSSRISKVDFVSVTTPANPSSRRCVMFPTRCVSHLNEYYSALGLSPFASKSDVKRAYKRLALKHHPDVIRAGNVAEKGETFREIKFAYERLMQKFEDEELQITQGYEEWEEWMGFEGGIPTTANVI
ncbi:hypothetical protein Dimus_006744 [Dionaea muscipula]